MNRACWILLGLMTACSSPAPPPPQPSVEVQTSVARLAPLTASLTAFGTTEFDPAASRTIPIEFEARLVDLSASVGQSVAEGAPLMTLQPSASTRLELGRLQREARASAAELGRLERLREDDLATNTEVDTARLAADSAAQSLASLSERARGTHLVIRAPLAGIIDALPFSPGDVAPAGSIVARIGAPERLQVRLGLEPEDVARARVGQPVTLVALRPGATPQLTRIAAVDRRVDPQTRLASAIAQVPEAAAVLAGEPVRATIAIEERPSVLTVPRSAILFEGDQPYVFTVVAGKAARRNVTVGIEEGSIVEVASGVAAGDVVVVRGNYELEDGMAVRAAQALASDTP